MEAMKVVLIVLFAIISVLLILLVLIQNDEGGGMGGLLSGAGTSAFGSHSANVINKTTFVLVALFFVTAFAIARLNKAPAIAKDIQEDKAVEQTVSSDSDLDQVIDLMGDDLNASIGAPDSSLSTGDQQ